MLRLAVSSAVNLPNVETIGKSDPYVVLTFQGLYFLFFINIMWRASKFCIAWRWGERVLNNNIQKAKIKISIYYISRGQEKDRGDKGRA